MLKIHRNAGGAGHPPDELQEPLERMMDRTPVSAEDMDTESTIDASDGFGGREEAL